MPIIVAVLEAFGIAIVGADHYEADDVIGTLATGAGMPVDIVTGDRDLFQLVDDEAEVRVLYTARGVGKHERVTDDVVRREVRRRLPSQYADFATLRGDASDGLPGVAGVGDKTAAVLLQQVRRPRRDHRGGRRTRTATWARAARQDQGRRRLPRGRPDRGGRRPRHRPRLPRPDPALASPPIPRCSPRSPSSGASTSPVERLTETLASR